MRTADVLLIGLGLWILWELRRSRQSQPLMRI